MCVCVGGGRSVSQLDTTSFDAIGCCLVDEFETRTEPYGFQHSCQK